MQRIIIFLAYFFICVDCTAQQYPFVHYTPKDGLISNSIRGIYQDSKGRMYFTSINGLSVYDGARFINYSSKNGLGSDIVNCVMEMGDDSVWIATNDGRIQCLVNGKIRPVTLNEPPPIIDNLVRDEKGTLYAASEKGLFIFNKNKFVKLPFTDINGKNVNTYIGSIYPAGKHLLVVRDNSMLSTEERHILYLYDKETKKIIDHTENKLVFSTARAPDGKIWVSTNKNIMSVDTIELKHGKIVFQKLMPPYNKIEKNGLNQISFDQYGSLWLTDKVSVLKRLSPDGTLISFTTESGLGSLDISNIFLDREGIIWIATYSGGVDKLVNSNFSFSGSIFGISAINSIYYSPRLNQMVFYSPVNAKAVIVSEDGSTEIFDVDEPNKFSRLSITPKGLFGNSEQAIYKIIISGNRFYPKVIFVDKIDNQLGNPLVDKNGNLILCGKQYLTAVIDGKTIYRKKINYFFDHAALDKSGNIWIANRAGELTMYLPDPRNPTDYLKKEIIVSKQLPGISPRSIVIDKNDNIWIGTRNHGILVYEFKNGSLNQIYNLNTSKGLSDNFITELGCDSSNNIWACSPSGLDIISSGNDFPAIENLTKQNNIYQRVFNITIDKNNIAWSRTANGIIKVTPENRMATEYSPSLMVTMIKSGKDTIANTAATLSYKQNNLSFYFTATSFQDEKQVLYRYRLHGGNNTEWSEPSNNPVVSFIDLPAGNYILDIKANFPADRYPEQNIQYRFSIMPPWWQTWWFRTAAGLLIIGLLIMGVRFYYRRRLEIQKTILEKQQAVEKERTRIATDMHDDLGAGLSSIRFLSEKVKRNSFNDAIKNDIDKMQLTSNELMEKMNEIIWAMSEKNDSLEDLLFYTRSYAREYCDENNLDCIIHMPENIPALFVRGEIRRNIFLIVKESLHNIVKHAHAGKVIIEIIVSTELELTISDDGKGFTDRHTNLSGGNGIRNMQKRIASIGGVIDINNGQGVTLKMKVPLVPLNDKI